MINAIKDNWWYVAAEPPPPPPPPPPEPVLGWRGINKFCITSNGENTGQSMFDDLEQYDVNTLASTGVVKDNVQGDPDYIAPVQDTATCPITQYAWEGYQPYCITEENYKTIDNNTKIIVTFDDSGSMLSTRTKLENMIAIDLKNQLLPYYNSEADYNNKVSFFKIKDERFIKVMSDSINNNPTGNTILLVFQNEAFPAYEPITPGANEPYGDSYFPDITALNNSLNNYTHEFNAVVFQVNYEDDLFKLWLSDVKAGIGNYVTPNGFSNKDIAIKYDVLEGAQAGSSSAYYANLVIQELNNLGFNI